MNILQSTTSQPAHGSNENEGDEHIITKSNSTMSLPRSPSAPQALGIFRMPSGMLCLLPIVTDSATPGTPSNVPSGGVLFNHPLYYSQHAATLQQAPLLSHHQFASSSTQYGQFGAQTHHLVDLEALKMSHVSMQPPSRVFQASDNLSSLYTTLTDPSTKQRMMNLLCSQDDGIAQHRFDQAMKLRDANMQLKGLVQDFESDKQAVERLLTDRSVELDRQIHELQRQIQHLQRLKSENGDALGRLPEGSKALQNLAARSQKLTEDVQDVLDGKSVDYKEAGVSPFLDNDAETASVPPSSAATQGDNGFGVVRKYTDASTGKKYYSNGVTTTWEKPASFKVGEGNGFTLGMPTTSVQGSEQSFLLDNDTETASVNTAATVQGAIRSMLGAQDTSMKKAAPTAGKKRGAPTSNDSVAAGKRMKGDT